MDNHTCSECKHFHSYAPANPAFGFCRSNCFDVYCATQACNSCDLKPLAR